MYLAEPSRHWCTYMMPLAMTHFLQISCSYIDIFLVIDINSIGIDGVGSKNASEEGPSELANLVTDPD